MKQTEEEKEELYKDYKRFKEKRLNNKTLKKDVLFKLIDYAIEEFRAGSRD